jgi:hypothetical protein
MLCDCQVERSSSSYSQHRPRRPPPDLPSLLLHGRIVYIGMPVWICTKVLDAKFPFMLLLCIWMPIMEKDKH